MEKFPDLTTFGDLPGPCKWSGGVLGADGITVFGIPATAESVLAINTEERTAQTFGSLESEALQLGNKWCGGLLGPDKITIYCVPSSARTVLLIDTVDWKLSELGLGRVDNGASKWSGAVLGEDGTTVFCIPSNAPEVLTACQFHPFRRPSSPTSAPT